MLTLDQMYADLEGLLPGLEYDLDSGMLARWDTDEEDDTTFVYADSGEHAKYLIEVTRFYGFITQEMITEFKRDTSENMVKLVEFLFTEGGPLQDMETFLAVQKADVSILMDKAKEFDIKISDRALKMDAWLRKYYHDFFDEGCKRVVIMTEEKEDVLLGALISMNASGKDALSPAKFMLGMSIPADEVENGFSRMLECIEDDPQTYLISNKVLQNVLAELVDRHEEFPTATLYPTFKQGTIPHLCLMIGYIARSGNSFDAMIEDIVEKVDGTAVGTFERLVQEHENPRDAIRAVLKEIKRKHPEVPIPDDIPDDAIITSDDGEMMEFREFMKRMEDEDGKS